MVRTLANGISGILRSRRGTVARTDTAAKSLFTLPKSAFIYGFMAYAAANSDAATTAVLSIGKLGASDSFYGTQDVRQATTPVGNVTVKSQAGGSQGGTPVTVTGKYAETGTASTVGGPWTVTCLYES